jgi:hypothetical protein
MTNGTFQKGTWKPLPSNCTRSFTLTYSRCAEYGTVALKECLYYVIKYLDECVEWAQQLIQNCSWWAWLVCLVVSIITIIVCVAVATVAVAICGAIVIVWVVVCLLWALVSIIFCLSKANGGTSFLLTDGTVMMQEYKSLFGATWASRRWWKLTPDNSGSYGNGSWSQLADSNVGRTYFASGVLADGRVVVCGGEYSDASGQIQPPDYDNTCEIYDPVANTWSSFASPVKPGSTGAIWDEIGDAPCAVLPDGSFLMGSIDSANVAKLALTTFSQDPSTLTWTAMTARQGGVGTSDEDSWVLMPDNTIAAPSCQNPPTTWIYHISSGLGGVWSEGNPLPDSVVDVNNETGPALLRYDGTAFFLGANKHTAIYSPAASPQ